MVRRLAGMHGHGNIVGLGQLEQRLVPFVVQVDVLVPHVELDAQAVRVALQIPLEFLCRLFGVFFRNGFTLDAETVAYVRRLVVRFAGKGVPRGAQVDQAGRDAAEAGRRNVAVSHSDGKDHVVLLAGTLPEFPRVLPAGKLRQFVEPFGLEIMHMRVDDFHNMFFPYFWFPRARDFPGQGQAGPVLTGAVPPDRQPGRS